MDHYRKALAGLMTQTKTTLTDGREGMTDAEYHAEMERLEQERHEQAAKEREEQIIKNLVKYSGLNNRFRDRTFESFKVNAKNQKAYEDAKCYADGFCDGSGGLFISGSYGTGKTHLASAITNQLLNNKIPVICMTMISLLDKIKQTFDANETATEEEVLEKFTEVDLLIIDDMGSETPTEWAVQQMFKIINTRYEAYKPIIITTNYSPNELVKRMTPRNGDPKNAEKTVDRLREVCEPVQMNWDSWRKR